MAFISLGQSLPYEEEIQGRHQHIRIVNDAAQLSKENRRHQRQVLKRKIHVPKATNPPLQSIRRAVLE